MKTIEYEKTYLAKMLPEDLKMHEMIDLLDIYLPSTNPHPTLRIRKRGEKYEITKKEPVSGTDSSVQNEFTITLSKEEFDELEMVPGKRVHKHRYLYPYADKIIEIDVFKDDLEGLVLVDVECASKEEKDSITMPSFCLVEITQEAFAAGGMLAGKKYADIEKELDKWDYRKLS